MELYKDIKKFEGLYQISNLGNVKSMVGRYRKVNILKFGVTTAGYATITLCKDKKRYSKTIHRLVCETFLGKSDLHVNHKDGNKLNNNLDNLELVTRSENTKHAISKGLFIPNYEKIAIQKRKKIAQIDNISGETINIYESSHDASNKTKINRGNISSTCRGLFKTAGGYKWKYL
jgi:hypothetical protein